MQEELFHFLMAVLLIFGADMSSSVHANTKTKNIVVLGEGLTQRLDTTRISVDHRPIVVDDIPDIQKYMMEKNNIKLCLNLLKNVFLQQ